MNKNILKHSFFVILLLLLANSCKKDENELPDIDENVYHSVTIGTQTWIVENLKVTHYRNGDPIPNVRDVTIWDTLTTGAYCDYDNNARNAKIYGRLYNWYAVNDSRNLAPAGWHIATETEFRELIAYLGGEDVAGAKLKESGTLHWRSPNINAVNESGFTALPGGTVLGSGFAGLGESGNLWSATESTSGTAYYFCLHYLTGRAFVSTQAKTIGIAVRCVQN
jgi:uncharacterized protein (TIGR02145 family)